MGFVARYLMAQLLQRVAFDQVRRNETEIIVAGRARLPDLMVIGPDLVKALTGQPRSRITEDMPAPLLVVAALARSTHGSALVLSYNTLTR